MNRPVPPPSLAGPIDLDARRRATEYPNATLQPGLVVEHRGSGIVGAVANWGKGQVTIVDRRGANHRLPLERGGFALDGRAVTLLPPAASAPGRASPASGARTASGSVAPERTAARVARASRIVVEGRHDAELVEKVWGDDLRYEGVVVEPLDGVDHLDAVIAAFRPGPGRRLGVLVDHLVTGSKEQHLALAVQSSHVLVCGHPFVDIWAATDPALVRLTAWPDIPKGQDWKTGICAALGGTDPSQLWRTLLGRVRSYADLHPSLVGAVEQLIDFVTAEADDGEPSAT